MGSKYGVIKLSGCWAVILTGNEHIVETFETEQAAMIALGEFERGERMVSKKEDVWILDDELVKESGVSGMFLGVVEDLDMNQYNVVKRLTREEYSALEVEYHEEHGCYPDT